MGYNSLSIFEKVFESQLDTTSWKVLEKVLRNKI